MGQQAALFADRSSGDGWRMHALAVARPCFLWLKPLLVPCSPLRNDQRQLSCRRVRHVLDYCISAFLRLHLWPGFTILPQSPGAQGA